MKGKQLIAFDGSWKVGDCCARPANRVRYAQLGDILAWIRSNDIWEAVLEGYMAGDVPPPPDVGPAFEVASAPKPEAP